MLVGEWSELCLLSCAQERRAEMVSECQIFALYHSDLNGVQTLLLPAPPARKILEVEGTGGGG